MFDALPPPSPSQTIVVTGRALADPASEQAFAVEAIGREQIEHSPSGQMEELLEQVPGIQLFRRSDARSGHPTSQGVTLRSLGGNASSRALLILDGVPQADPFGGWVNWPAYDPASLAEVRIIRGGGSVTGGPGALAGVIEMQSRSAPGLDAAVAAGSRDSLEGRFYAGQALGAGFLGISAYAARGDGFIPVTAETRGPADIAAPYKLAGGRARFATPLSDLVEVQASLFAFTDRRERGLAFTDNRTDGADASLRLVGSGRAAWSALAYVQARELSSSFASVDDDRAVATQVALQDEVPSNAIGVSAEVRPVIGSGLEFRLGADTRRTEGESRELYFYVDGEPTRRRRAGGETLTAGAFAELTGRFGGLALTGGARLDHWRVSGGNLHERVIATGEVLRDERTDDRSGWLPTARLGAVVNVGEGASLRSAAYLGWRLPTLNELFRPFRAGADATAANAALDPERLAGIEAGADFRRGGLSLSASLFVNRLSDGIANVTIARGPGVFPGVGFVGENGEYRQRRNLDAILVRGIEGSAEYARGEWALRGGFSLADAEVQADGAAAALDGLRPAQTPQLVVTGGVGWERDGRAAMVQLRHSGSQYEDDLNQDLLPAATTLDAFASWPLTRDLQIVARGENIFDERVIAGIGGDRSIEQATLRTLWLELRFSRSPSR